MEARRASLCAVVAAFTLAGCGGGGERQDENEPEGDFQVQVLSASFPDEQKLAKRSTMEIVVKNAGQETIPNIAVTVKSQGGVGGFDQRRDNPSLADPVRPQFVVNTSPKGGTTANVGTSALGELGPGKVRTFRWSVTAVRPGDYELEYTIAAGLNGKAKAVLAGGGPAEGSFVGTVNGEAPDTRIAEDGKTIIYEDSRTQAP